MVTKEKNYVDWIPIKSYYYTSISRMSKNKTKQNKGSTAGHARLSLV